VIPLLLDQWLPRGNVRHLAERGIDGHHVERWSQLGESRCRRRPQKVTFASTACFANTDRDQDSPQIG